MEDRSVIWSWLRASRSQLPSGLTEDDDRALLYRAAMQQFEDLMRAASASTVASRALPLFYALSQASRAVIARRKGDDPTGHGLKFEFVAGDQVLEATVKPAQGLFTRLSETVGSPDLSEPVKLGALISSLPDFSDTMFPTLSGWPQPAYFWQEVGEYSWMLGPYGKISGAVVLVPAPTSVDEAEAALQTLPTLAKVEWSIRQQGVPGGWRHVPTPRGDGIGIVLSISNLDEVAPEYRWHGNRWLRPAIAEREAPTPLLTWWALLFGLSNLARYNPVAWTQAISFDASPVAEVLNRVLAVGLEAVPQLLLSAIAQENILLERGPLR